MRNVTTTQLQILTLIREHGPLSFAELVRATERELVCVYDDIQYLRSHGFALLLSDDRVRLAIQGRRALEEARVG